MWDADHNAETVKVRDLQESCTQKGNIAHTTGVETVPSTRAVCSWLELEMTAFRVQLEIKKKQREDTS
jgi:hypothetical protein